jgi:hypothetical protein
MGEILKAPAPYGMLYEAEGLIQTVGQVNGRLIEQARKRVTTKISDLVEEIKKELDAVSADGHFRGQCLGPLERLLEQAMTQESIAHLGQAEQEAVKALDAAMGKIEAFVSRPPVKEGAAKEPPQEMPKVTVKPRYVLRPADLVTTSYLETEEEMEKFLRELRDRLAKAIQAGQRIQIR